MDSWTIPVIKGRRRNGEWSGVRAWCGETDYTLISSVELKNNHCILILVIRSVCIQEEHNLAPEICTFLIPGRLVCTSEMLVGHRRASEIE